MMLQTDPNSTQQCSCAFTTFIFFFLCVSPPNVNALEYGWFSIIVSSPWTNIFLPSSIQIDTIDLYRLGRLWLWYKSAEFRTSEIQPPRPLPSIGLSHVPVRQRFELLSRFSIDFNGKSRTQPRMASEIRRVTEAWNTPARLYPSPPFDMCTRRRRIPSVSKRIHAIPSTKHPRLPVFALTLNSMERLDQGCDRRVESDFNTDSY